MAIIVLHTGQTGVERGAHRAARQTGMTVGGFCSFEGRDELDPLPSEMMADLVPCTRRGARSALHATLETADAMVIVVPDVDLETTYPGVRGLLRAARTRSVPYWTIDPTTGFDHVTAALRQLETRRTDPLRVLVTGPRGTRWSDGERFGFRTIADLSMTPSLVASKLRILVVDDDVESARATYHVVRALGHEAAVATSGTQGLELAEQFSPNVGLIDIRMPDISGYDVARQMRAARRDALFLAAITGWEDARDPKRSFEAGFDRHIVKPTSVDLIRSVIDQAALAT